MKIEYDKHYPKGIVSAHLADYPVWEALPGGKGQMCTTRWYGRDTHGRRIRYNCVVTITEGQEPIYQFSNMVIVATGEAYDG